MAERPDYQAKLRAEMDEAFENDTYGCGKQSPLLDGIINECLRLYPSVIFQSQRLTPPEGLTIGNVYIPGDTIICLGPYQQGRGNVTRTSFRRLQLILSIDRQAELRRPRGVYPRAVDHTPRVDLEPCGILPIFVGCVNSIHIESRVR